MWSAHFGLNCFWSLSPYNQEKYSGSYLDYFKKNASKAVGWNVLFVGALTLKNRKIFLFGVSSVVSGPTAVV